MKLEDIVSHEGNITELVDPKTLEGMGKTLQEGYETDLRSRDMWEDKYDDWMKLALQVIEKKSFPWDDAANVKYPLLSTAALQFSSRAYPALVPGFNVVKGRVNGFDPDGRKLDRAIRVGKHMSYQILEEMDGWEEEMDKLCTALPIIGTMFKKTYFSSQLGRNISELVYPKDLVVNYWSRSLETSYRKSHILYLSNNDVYERVAAGIFKEVMLNAKAFDKKQVSDEATGSELQSTVDESTPHKFVETHTFWDLDEDGYEEPYIITWYEETGEVVRIATRFEEEDLVYNTINGRLVRINPTEYFTKFSFVPNPDGGFYDIGFGLLLGPINETINTLINQLLDSGTINNLQAGFLAKGIRVQGGATGFRPGEWKTATFTGEDLRKGIVPLPTKEPSNVLFNLLGMLVEGGHKLSAVTDILTGENPGQNQPATTTMAVIEQGLKVFSSIYKRLHRALKKEYQKLYKLNGLYLEDQEYFTILDWGQEQGEVFGRQDYSSGDVAITPYSDPNVASESQKLAKLQALAELIPLGTINPAEYTRRALEAQEQPAPEQLMEMPPPQPNPEFELEQFKVEDESKREWALIEIRAEESGVKNFDREVSANVKRFKAQVDAEEKINEREDKLRGVPPMEGEQSNSGT